MAKKKIPFGSVEALDIAIAEQEAWIDKCGRNLAGYIANYGDPEIDRANGKPMAGNGGTAIFNADMAWLTKLRALRAARVGSRGNQERAVQSTLEVNRIRLSTWFTMTIDEPFPVLCGIGLFDRSTFKGPYYAPGSTWYYPAEQQEWFHQVVEYWRLAGFTVTTGVERR